MTTIELINLLLKEKEKVLDEANEFNKVDDYFEGYYKCGVAEGLQIAIDILLKE